MLKPFKFLVQVVLLEVDEDGNPVNERVSEQPEVFYGVQALEKWAQEFDAALADAQKEVTDVFLC